MAKRKPPKKPTEKIEVEEAEVVELPKPEVDDVAEAPADAPLDEASAEEPTSGVIAVDTPEKAPAKRGGVVPLVIGGVIAGAIGFGAAYLTFDTSQSVSDLEVQHAALEAKLARLEGAQAQLAEGLAGKENANPDFVDQAALKASVAALGQDMGAQLSGLRERLLEVEKRPLADGGLDEAAMTAYQQELDGLRAILESQNANNAALAEEFKRLEAQAKSRLEEAADQAIALQAEADAAAKLTIARAALTQVEAKLASGGAFDGDLRDLQAASAVDIPAALTAVAGDGVASLSDLQTEVAVAARAALSAARANPEDGESTNRLTAFLQNQLGTRSLEPKEGSDPDAVLSRVEDAVRKGELPRALEELEGLPAAGRTEMADWEAAARTRVDALAAAAALASRLSQN